MMVAIYDIFDLDALDKHFRDGNVRMQRHPKFPLKIYNYTHKCMYDGIWDHVTKACRGLIVREDGEIIARPFRKFFNYGQAGAPELDLDHPVIVTDKMDGSLGVGYTWEGEPYIATRGSFTSEQAIWASLHLCDQYPEVAFPEGFTPLFEIVYPENRIVLNYGDTEALVLLGEVEIETGTSRLPWRKPADGWYPGPSVAGFLQHNTLAKALAAPPRPNAEGLVIHDLATDERIKLKQDDYVALHRILTRTNARAIWTYLAVNACKHLISEPKYWGSKLGIGPEEAAQVLAVGPQWMEHLLAKVPDEFYAYVRKVVTDLTEEVVLLEHQARARIRDLKPLLRSAAAPAIKAEPNPGLLWLLYDDKDITTALWKKVYPPVDTPWMATNEDVA